MENGFWKQLKKPIVALAPMANVTDAAFRQMFAECGPPDVYWTEFVSVEGLLSPGKQALLPDFWYGEAERPIVAQIFGVKPEQFEEVGALVRELGFDGVDVNMGCPDKGVEKQGAGAALIKNPEEAKHIIRALKKGAAPLPISVKTRIGYAKDEIQTWIPALLEEGLAALTVHLRTRKEMSDVPAHWELAPEIVRLREKYAPDTLLLGNGDVSSLEETHEKIERSGMDGVMIGRGIFGNPWFFSGRIPDLQERLERMVRHTETFEEMYMSNTLRQSSGQVAQGDMRSILEKSSKVAHIKRFEVMKKHFKAYANGFDGARELRAKLMETENAAGVRKITEEFLKTVVT